MGMSWRRGSGARFEGIPEIILEAYKKKLDDAMDEVIAQAVYDMRAFTATRPSAKSGKGGRIDTSDMLNAIDGEVLWDSVDRLVGRFGFTDRQELYFMWQTTTGFRHYKSGEFIEPTFALRDAAVAAVQNLLGRMGSV
jgi:hypothetical protein